MPYRVAFMVLAFVVVLGGLALIPLPGPGWAIVFVGLGMLALEFEWAENLMEKVLDRLEAAKEAAENASPAAEGARRSALTVLGIAAFVVAAILWDIPLLPVSRSCEAEPCRRRRRRARRRRRRGRRGVLELLLGAEQRVEHLLAQALGDGERDAAR